MAENLTDFLDVLDGLAARTKVTIAALNTQIERFAAARDILQRSIDTVIPLAVELRKHELHLFSNADMERFVQRNRAIVEKPVKTVTLPEPDPEPADPMWMIIKKGMSGKPSFTASEAGQLLERVLQRSLGRNRPQLVRNNLLRHKDVFHRNPNGSWSVISTEKEAPEETS